jgi:biopolymer transport protein ExbB
MDLVAAFDEHVLTIWVAGGYLMIPLFLLTCFIYFSVLELFLYLGSLKFTKSDPNEWGHWIDAPKDAQGQIGEMIRFSQEGARNLPDVRARFAELHAAYLPRIDRRITFLALVVSTAPLTGLLGTVIGMLATFSGLSVSTGGNTVDLVAGGISQALITTQAGLVIAIPAYVLIAMIKRRRNEVEAFLSQLESLTLQRYQRVSALSSTAA